MLNSPTQQILLKRYAKKELLFKVLMIGDFGVGKFYFIFSSLFSLN